MEDILLSVGRRDGRWFVAASGNKLNARAFGETIGELAGHVVDILSTLQPRVLKDEAQRARAGEAAFSPPTETGRWSSEHPNQANLPPQDRRPATKAIDHFLEGDPEVAAALEKLAEGYGEHDPLRASRFNLAGDRPPEFYEGMAAALSYVAVSRAMISRILGQSVDTYAVTLHGQLTDRVLAALVQRRRLAGLPPFGSPGNPQKEVKRDEAGSPGLGLDPA